MEEAPVCHAGRLFVQAEIREKAGFYKIRERIIKQKAPKNELFNINSLSKRNFKNRGTNY
jgi:hypothetical protein